MDGFFRWPSPWRVFVGRPVLYRAIVCCRVRCCTVLYGTVWYGAVLVVLYCATVRVRKWLVVCLVVFVGWLFVMLVIFVCLVACFRSFSSKDSEGLCFNAIHKLWSNLDAS